MKQLKLIKIIASFLMVASVLALNPIRANAEWRNKSTAYWYSEGNSYATGWRFISGYWYYFNEDGYMLEDRVVDGWYLDPSGIGTECVVLHGINDFTVAKSSGMILKFYNADAAFSPGSIPNVSLVIPSEIDGIKITSIANYAFPDCVNLISITLPDSITSIQDYTFRGCPHATFYVKSTKLKQLLMTSGVSESKIVLSEASNNTSLNIENENTSS